MKTKSLFIPLLAFLLCSCGSATTSSPAQLDSSEEPPVTSSESVLASSEEPVESSKEPAVESTEESIWEPESEDREIYSQGPYRPEIDKITIHTFDEFGPTTYTIKVKEGQNLSYAFAAMSPSHDNLDSYYLLGIYLDAEYQHKIHASQITSFDCTYDTVYLKMVKKKEVDHYLERLYGTYKNCLEEELVLDKNGLRFELTIEEGKKVTVEATDIVTDNALSPYAKTVKVNDVAIPVSQSTDRTMDISVYPFLAFYDEDNGLYDFTASALVISIIPGGLSLHGLLNWYYQEIGSSYRISSDSQVGVELEAKAIYSAPNDFTIVYDLEA